MVGHDALIRRFRRLLADDRLAHAYLLHGMDGIGKYQLAFRIALARLCRQREDDACGSCLDCRLARSNDHPDLHPVDETGSSRIRIDVVRELIRRSVQKPYRAQGRVILVRDAERMTDEAQNAFLKTLEEPPDRCLIILTSSRPQGLLPTIRSRCQESRLKALTGEQTRAVLERAGAGADRLALLGSISGGSPGNALALEAGGFLPLRTALLELVSGTCGDPLGLAEAVVVKMRESEEGVRHRTQVLVEMWISVLRDLLLVRAGLADESLWNRDLASAIGSTARARSIEALEDGLEAAFAALKSLSVNASPDLVVSDLALGLA
jgi:DNA polymerase-3 subunit delta'